MHFVSIRIITDDVKQLVQFYEQATGQAANGPPATPPSSPTPSCTLAIASARTVQMLGVNAPRPANNHTVIIEFRVDDVDREYENLKQFTNDFVNAPTTLPWGNRR